MEYYTLTRQIKQGCNRQNFYTEALHKCWKNSNAVERTCMSTRMTRGFLWNINNEADRQSSYRYVERGGRKEWIQDTEGSLIGGQRKMLKVLVIL